MLIGSAIFSLKFSCLAFRLQKHSPSRECAPKYFKIGQFNFVLRFITEKNIHIFQMLTTPIHPTFIYNDQSSSFVCFALLLLLLLRYHDAVFFSAIYSFVFNFFSFASFPFGIRLFYPTQVFLSVSTKTWYLL
jgi:hypothetical protein